MVSGSKSAKGKESHEIQLFSNKVKQLKFKPISEVAYKNDPIGALPSFLINLSWFRMLKNVIITK